MKSEWVLLKCRDAKNECVTVMSFFSSSNDEYSLLFRAILCNDSLVKKLEELERTEEMYSGLVDHSRRVLMGYFDLVRVSKVIIASYWSTLIT